MNDLRVRDMNASFPEVHGPAISKSTAGVNRIPQIALLPRNNGLPSFWRDSTSAVHGKRPKLCRCSHWVERGKVENCQVLRI